MCADMVTMNRGLVEAAVVRAAVPFFEEKIAAGIFPDMRALVLELNALSCEVWAVSSTSEWVIRAGMKYFEIPPDRVLAAAVAAEDGKVTDKVIRVPSGKGKPKAIRDRFRTRSLETPSGTRICWKSRIIHLRLIQRRNWRASPGSDNGRSISPNRCPAYRFLMAAFNASIAK